MPTRRTDDDQPPPRDGVEANAESVLHQPDPDDTNPAGDQDIDTAGTDADDESPTKAMGTGIARPRSRG